MKLVLVGCTRPGQLRFLCLCLERSGLEKLKLVELEKRCLDHLLEVLVLLRFHRSAGLAVFLCGSVRGCVPFGGLGRRWLGKAVLVVVIFAVYGGALGCLARLRPLGREVQVHGRIKVLRHKIAHAGAHTSIHTSLGRHTSAYTSLGAQTSTHTSLGAQMSAHIIPHTSTDKRS